MKNLITKVITDRLFFYFILLCLFYIITSSIGFPLNIFDFILVIYIFSIYYIDKDNIAWYSLVFGLFFDSVHDTMLGVGFFLFLFLNIFKLKFTSTVNISTFYGKFIFIIGMVALYTFIVLNIFHHPWEHLLLDIFYSVLVNVFAIVIVFSVFGRKSAI